MTDTSRRGFVALTAAGAVATPFLLDDALARATGLTAQEIMRDSVEDGYDYLLFDPDTGDTELLKGAWSEKNRVGQTTANLRHANHNN